MRIQRICSPLGWFKDQISPPTFQGFQFYSCARILFLIYIRFCQEGGEEKIDDKEKVLVVMRKFRSERSNQDNQKVADWMFENSCLPSLSRRRLLDLARLLKLVEMDGDEILFEQGDEGDAFYVVFEGELVIEVNEERVGLLHESDSFGERALENDETRAATIVSTIPSLLFRLSKVDYASSIAASETAKLQKTILFFQNDVFLLRSLNYARIFQVAR